MRAAPCARRTRRLRSQGLPRAVDGDREPTTAVDVDALDPAAQRVAQAERLGALHEGALLARFNQRETAVSLAQQLGGAGAVGKPDRGADQKHQARLVVT